MGNMFSDRRNSIIDHDDYVRGVDKRFIFHDDGPFAPDVGMKPMNLLDDFPSNVAWLYDE
jgi:hypothetical protein